MAFEKMHLENNLVIIITPKSSHRSIGITLSIIMVFSVLHHGVSFALLNSPLLHFYIP